MDIYINTSQSMSFTDTEWKAILVCSGLDEKDNVPSAQHSYFNVKGKEKRDAMMSSFANSALSCTGQAPALSPHVLDPDAFLLKQWWHDSMQSLADQLSSRDLYDMRKRIMTKLVRKEKLKLNENTTRMRNYFRRVLARYESIQRKKKH